MCGRTMGQEEQSDLRKDWTQAGEPLETEAAAPSGSPGLVVACIGFLPRTIRAFYPSG